MSLTFEQIMLTAYRDEFALGQFSLADYNDGNGVVIDNWNVPDVPMPTQQEVMVLDTPTLESLFTFYAFVDKGRISLARYIDSVAKQKQYENAISCASYVNSTMPSWAEEASTFIAWRDAVYSYTITQQQLMKTGSRTIPTEEEFQAELPVISWP